MQFNDFELGLLLLLVTQKKLELKINILELSSDKKYVDATENNKQVRECILALESTEKLHDKIKKYLEE